MKRFLSIVTLVFLLFSSCAHTVSITSEPNDAEVFVDGRQIGKTPCVFKEKTSSGKTYQFRVSKNGHRTSTHYHFTTDTNLTMKTVGIIGTIFLLFPFILLIYDDQLPDNLHFDLVPLSAEDHPMSIPSAP